MKPFRKSDVKAPRVRKNILRILNPEYYAKFKKAYPGLKVSGKDIKNVVNVFHELSVDVIANNRDGLELMEQLGHIILGSCKPKNLQVDKPKSSEYGVELTHRDWDSNGWVCKVAYTNEALKYRFKNANLWAFEAARKLKRAVSDAYKKDYKKYIILDNKFKLKQAFRESNKRLKEKLKQQKDNG